MYITGGGGGDIHKTHKLRTTQQCKQNVKFLTKLQVQFWNHVILNIQECYKGKNWDFRFSLLWLRTIWPSGLWQRVVWRQPDVSVECIVSIFRVGDGSDVLPKCRGLAELHAPVTVPFKHESAHVSGRSSDQLTQPEHLSHLDSYSRRSQKTTTPPSVD
jgi:hypothetical protein